MRLGQSWRCEWSVEIGYWYWDEEELVMRGLLTPRGIAVLAGGTAKPDDTIITVAAASESDTFGILSNPYLLDTACTTSFEVNLDLSQPNRFSYDQMTYMHDARLGGCHQDRNTLTLICRTPGLGQTAGVETHEKCPTWPVYAWAPMMGRCESSLTAGE